MRERPVEWGHAASGGRGDPNLFQLITQGPERTINPWTGRGYASSADAARHNALLSYYGMPASQAPSGGTPGQIFESEDPREALLRRQRWEQMDAENAYSGAYDKGADWASLASYGRG